MTRRLFMHRHFCHNSSIESVYHDDEAYGMHAQELLAADGRTRTIDIKYLGFTNLRPAISLRPHLLRHHRAEAKYHHLLNLGIVCEQLGYFPHRVTRQG